MKKKRIIIIAVIVLAAAGGVFFYYRQHNKAVAVTYQTSEAAKGTLISTVSGSGNIEVSSSASVKPSISGTVANVKVSAGDGVKRGQTLFTITNPDLDVSVGKAYTTLLQARQKLTDAQSSLVTAQKNYNDLVKDPGLTEAQQAYDKANEDLVQAKYQLEQDEDTLDKYEDENTTTAGTHSDTEINLIKYKITSDESEITAKEKAVWTALNNLNRAKAGTTTEVTDAKNKVESGEISVQVAENDVKSAQIDYDNQKKSAAERTVTAPIAGTVSAVNVANGDELGSSTSSASNTSQTGSSASIVIQDLASLKATISINEVDIASVKVDQKASMTFDAITDLTLTGKVEKVDTVGTSTQGVVSYSATIGFDSLDSRVRPEMSVNATITIDVKQDVLIVPSSAVKTSGETYYVQILQDGKPVQQTVEIGATNDTQTEIISGLTSGTAVVTQTITAGKTSTPNTGPSSSGSFRGGFGGGELNVITGPGGGF